MTSKKEMKLALCLAVILLGIGIVCYAAFPVKAPEEPFRIMYKSTAGKVLFTHYKHADDTGYALICRDCHHRYENDSKSTPKACNACHPAKNNKSFSPDLTSHELKTMEEQKVYKRVDALHAQCIDCHKEIGFGPVECVSCHVM